MRATHSVSPSESVVGLGPESKDGWLSSASPPDCSGMEGIALLRCSCLSTAFLSSTFWADRKSFCRLPEQSGSSEESSGPSYLAPCCNSRLSVYTKGSIRSAAWDAPQATLPPFLSSKTLGKGPRHSQEDSCLRGVPLWLPNHPQKEGFRHSLRATVGTPPHLLHMPETLQGMPSSCPQPVHLQVVRPLSKMLVTRKNWGSGYFLLSLLLGDFGMSSLTAIVCSQDARDCGKERSPTRDLASENTTPLAFLSCCQRGLKSLQMSLCCCCPRTEVSFMSLGLPARRPSNDVSDVKVIAWLLSSFFQN